MAIYEDIRKIYELLNSDHYNLNEIKGLVKNLMAKGVDKTFMKTTFQILANEKIVVALMEELGQK